MRITWAFNPFDRNPKLQKKAIAILKALGGPRAQVEAVYVASPNEFELAAAFDVPVAIRFSEHPETLIAKAFRKLRFHAARVTVLEEPLLSLTSSVQTLAAHLARTRADLTVMASHARKGVPRLFIGSFAETLVPLATTDLLLFHESSRVPARRPKTLLYAHDLSPEGERGFERALHYAKTWKCALHILHVPEPAFGLRFDDQDPRVETYRSGVRRKIRRVEASVKRARVRGSVVIDAEWVPISELVLAQARRVGADLVLVLAKSGRIAGAMGGSVTRQLVRAAPVPVLVIKSR